jgi:hypothetical protein
MSGPEDGHVRVSDQERERVAAQLREHFAAGRLSDDELGDRLAAVYGAKTKAELREVSSDLPQLPATPSEQRVELAARRRRLSRRLVQQSGAGFCTFLVCVAIWASSGGDGQFWPIWVLLIVLVPLVRGAWRLFGPDPELDRLERELKAVELSRDRRERARTDKRLPRERRPDRWG